MTSKIPHKSPQYIPAWIQDTRHIEGKRVRLVGVLSLAAWDIVIPLNRNSFSPSYRHTNTLSELSFTQAFAVAYLECSWVDTIRERNLQTAIKQIKAHRATKHRTEDEESPAIIR